MTQVQENVVRLRGDWKRDHSDERPTPNHNREAERATLGAMVVNNATIDTVRQIISVEHFFDERNRLAFAAALALRDRGEPVDLITLKNEIAINGYLEQAGGPGYVAGLVDGVPSTRNADYYARIVRQAADDRAVGYAADVALRQLADNPADCGNALEVLRQAIDARSTTTAEQTPISEPLQGLAARLADCGGRRPLLGDLITEGEITLFHGQPRDKKSFCAQEGAIAIALGSTVAAFGLEEYRAGAVPRIVWMINGEDAAASVLDRLRQLLAGHGITDLPDTLHITAGRGLDLDDPATQARVIAEAQRLGAALVILDPLRSLSACVDQGPAELRPFAAFLRRFVRETGAGLLLVHHDTKPAANGPDTRRRAQRASGGALFSIVDSPVHVERIDESRSLVHPDGFKHGADPSPFTVELVVRDGAMLLNGTSSATATSAGDVVVQGKVRDYLTEHPGRSGKQITDALRGIKRLTVLEALEGMRTAGDVDFILGAHGAKLWSLR